MKKRIAICMAAFMLALSIFPAAAVASEKPIATLQASSTSSRVSYNGTAAEEVSAAAVLLFSSNGSLIIMDTCEVKPNGTFTGYLDVSLSSGTYIIKAADYEGGEFTVTTFTRTANAETNYDAPPVVPPINSTKVPNTGDSDGFLWMGMMVSGMLLYLLTLLLRRVLKRV